MKRPIFVSVGRSESVAETKFIAKIYDRLEQRGLELVRADNQAENPIADITKRILKSDGVVTIVFERFRADQIDEFPNADGGPNRLNDFRITTVWNQIESAIARTLGRQVLILAQHGCRKEGMIEFGRVHWLNFTDEALNDQKFAKAIEEWLEDIDETKRAGALITSLPGGTEKNVPETITVYKLLKSLTFPQMWALLVAIGTLAGLALWAGWKLGPIVMK